MLQNFWVLLQNFGFLANSFKKKNFCELIPQVSLPVTLRHEISCKYKEYILFNLILCVMM